MIHFVVIKGFFFAQASLFVVWASFGNTPAYARLPSLLAIFVMLSYIYPGISLESLLNNRWAWEYSQMFDGQSTETFIFYFVELAILATSTLAPLLVVRWLGLRIPSNRKTSWYRFTLFDVLAWTFSFAMVFAICRWLTTVGWSLEGTILVAHFLADSVVRLIIFGLITAFLSIIILKENRPPWQLILAACLPIAGSLGDYHLTRALDLAMLDNTLVPYVAMYLAYALMLISSLLVIRSCGVHLNRNAKPPPDVI